jgi:hypothetical protein
MENNRTPVGLRSGRDIQAPAFRDRVAAGLFPDGFGHAAISSVAVVILLLGLVSVTMLQAAEPPGPVLNVQLGLEDGWIKVDRNKTTLTAGPAFMTLTDRSTGEIKRQLEDYLDKVYRTQGRLVEQLLTPEARQALRRNLLDRATLEGWDRITTNWSSVFLPLNQWRLRHSGIAQGLPEDAFRKLLSSELRSQVYTNGPAYPLIEADDADGLPGIIPYAIAPPFFPEYLQSVRPTRNIDEWRLGRITPADLSRTLKNLEGELWFRTNVWREIGDYLEVRGHSVRLYREGEPEPPTSAGLLPERPRFLDDRIVNKRILISPDPTVAGILIRVPTNDLYSIKLALYMVLPTDDFRQIERAAASGRLADYVQPWRDIVQPREDTTNYVAHLSFTNGAGAQLRFPKMFLTRRFLAERLRHLNTAGFEASLINFELTRGPERLKTVELSISRLEVADAAMDPAAGASESVVFDRGTNAVTRETFAKETARKDETLRRAAYEPEFKNLFRVGAEYQPRKEPRFTVAYSRAGLGANNAVSGELGYQEEFLGNANYTHDFLGFDGLDKRLQVTVGGFSDFVPDRLASGSEFDERRSGGSVAAQLELFRDLNRSWLRLDLGGGYREVTVEQGGESVSSDGIASLDTGLLFMKSWDGTPGAARLEVEPILRLAHARRHRDWFALPSLTARYHRFVSSFWQWDIAVHGEISTHETPTTELPSLGGEDTVRGYRADAGLGRAVWAVQNEIWMPLRWDMGLPEGFDRFLRRNLALAAFVDVGGVYDSVDQFSGFKAGAGLGLRMVWQDLLTFRLDWAHPLTSREDDRGGSMVYFSIATKKGF